MFINTPLIDYFTCQILSSNLTSFNQRMNNAWGTTHGVQGTVLGHKVLYFTTMGTTEIDYEDC